MATKPSVNIVENEDNFMVEVAAPGLDKKDFNVTVDDDILTISAERKDESEDKSGTFTRREFNYTSFSRSFHLPETCNSEKINANYKDGMLILEIPKREEAKKKPAKTIKIS
ncbi:MAG: Hsp20/alpha crystallin family protein [Saprospirales bacterium]|nr:MAG: Hsp20/alpha crystallin family protein [Saprospirales bacterium]